MPSPMVVTGQTAGPDRRAEPVVGAAAASGSGPKSRRIRLRGLIAGSAVLWLLAGCGLGDLPTRSLQSSEPPSAGPTATPSPPASPTPSASSLPTPSPQPTALTYVVKAGDSLVNLGHRYHTTGRSIAYWNRKAYPNLDPDKPSYNPNHLEIGWRLTIYPGLVDDDGNGLPDQTASPPPPIAPSIPPAPTAPADGTGLLVKQGPAGGNDIALTFDLDTTGTGLDIVNWLVAQRVPATIFVTGQQASSDPVTGQVLRLVAAHPDLLTLGNASNDNAAMSTMSAAQVSAEVTTTEAAISAAGGPTSKPFFRPPFGAENPTIVAAAASAGFDDTVLWSVDPNDATPSAQGGPTAEDIVSRVVSRATGGAIVLLHLGGEHTLEALPGIVDGLNQAGYAPVDLARMLQP
jgi:peptidoglycan/xylan/chitin deacetylase (PgdA/CDA1 family)